MPPQDLPLDGVLVVALEQAVAAPLASRHLAELGARVLKIERPDGGDFARAYDDVVDGMASHFIWLNRSKESVVLDLKTPAGIDALHALLGWADVFLQNLAPGATARLGLDADTLTGRYPRLVVCDLSGYGAGGPLSGKRAYDLLVQAEAGLVAVTGSPEQPAKAGSPVADLATGLYAAQGILAALLQRHRTGRGGAVSVAMFDAVTEFMGHAVISTRHTGRLPERAGLGHAAIVPYDAYPTRDGQVVLGVQNDREWARLATEVLDCQELATHPDYATNVARVRNRSAVDAIIADALAQLSLAEATGRLDRAGIANARLSSVQDLIDHPQLSARDRWRDVDSPVGPVRVSLPPVDIAGLEPRLGPVPALGAHTDAVLREFGVGP